MVFLCFLCKKKFDEKIIFEIPTYHQHSHLTFHVCRLPVYRVAFSQCFHSHEQSHQTIATSLTLGHSCWSNLHWAAVFSSTPLQSSSITVILLVHHPHLQTIHSEKNRSNSNIHSVQSRRSVLSLQLCRSLSKWQVVSQATSFAPSTVSTAKKTRIVSTYYGAEC